MRIILIVHQFPPKYTAGTEVLTFSVAKELISRGHDVIVLTGAPADRPMSDPERFSQYEFDGIKVHQFAHQLVPMGGQESLLRIEYENNLASEYFSKLIDDFLPDLVHIFHMARFGAGIVDVAKSSGLRIYFTPTDFWSVCPYSRLMFENGKSCSGPRMGGGNCVKHMASLSKRKLFRSVVKVCPDWLVWLLIKSLRLRIIEDIVPFGGEVLALSGRQAYILSRLNAINGILSPTNFMTDVLMRNGVNVANIHQKIYGIDISRYKSSIRALHVGVKLKIGFIGSLTPHKGCHILMDALAMVDPKSYSLKIYGNSSEMPDYYERLVSSARKMPSVEFCGVFDNSIIGDVLSEIDILVVPSLWFENSPLVVHSALSAGCPVLASNFPGLSEVVVDGLNGILFDPGNASDLAESINKFLNNRSLLQALSENCKPQKNISAYVDDMEWLWGMHGG